MPFMRERLKQRRLDMGITLQEVADIIGVEKPTVQRYESGKIAKIDTMTVERLAAAVRCNPSYLMGWSDNPSLSIQLEAKVTSEALAVASLYDLASSDDREAIQAILRKYGEEGKNAKGAG